MDRKEELRRRIYEIEDTIRTAPQDTPNRVVFDWYRQTDTLREELDELESGRDDVDVVADESNLTAFSNADTEDRATDIGREDFVHQWNEDGGEPEAWSQIVGTAKEPV